MTARWVVDEVRPARDLRITWQPISLLFKNDADPADERAARAWFTHRLLRVMESVRAEGGDVEAFYWECGRRIHHDQTLDWDVADALDAVGLDRRHAEAFDDDAWDAEIRRRMDEGLELTGQDVGTPIIALDNADGDKVAYFGPVITRVPETEHSLQMWDALTAMMDVPGFWELKRTRTERPEFGDRP